MAKAADIIRRRAAVYRPALMRYAMGIARDAEIAEELVQMAFVDAMASDFEMVDDEALGFLCRIVSYGWRHFLARRRVRSGSFSIDGLEGEIGFISRLSVQPNQQQRAELAEAEREMQRSLEPVEREMLKLSALGYNQKEISGLLQHSTTAVQTRLSSAREKMCRAAGRPLPNRAWNTTGFRGVARSNKKWAAQLQTGKDRNLYLGLFDTPEEAAMAFDFAALWKLGDRATLNFPEFRNQLQARIDAGERPTPKRVALEPDKPTVNAKLTITQVAEIKRRIQGGDKPSVIANDYGVSRSLISRMGREYRSGAAPVARAA